MIPLAGGWRVGGDEAPPRTIVRYLRNSAATCCGLTFHRWARLARPALAVIENSPGGYFPRFSVL